MALVGLVGGLLGIALENRRRDAVSKLEALEGEHKSLMEQLTSAEAAAQAQLRAMKERVRALETNVAETGKGKREAEARREELAEQLKAVRSEFGKKEAAWSDERQRMHDENRESLMAARAELEAQLEEQRGRLREWRRAIAHLLSSARFQESDADDADAQVLRDILAQIDSAADNGSRAVQLNLGGLVTTLSLSSQTRLAGLLRGQSVAEAEVPSHKLAASASESQGGAAAAAPGPRARSPKALRASGDADAARAPRAALSQVSVNSVPKEAPPHPTKGKAPKVIDDGTGGTRLLNSATPAKAKSPPAAHGKEAAVVATKSARGGSWRFQWGSGSGGKAKTGAAFGAALDDEHLEESLTTSK